MAKTNWQLNEIVMPSDMNQIGTEINAKAQKVDTEVSGLFLQENRVFSILLGNRYSIANSPNQVMEIRFPSVSFLGNLKVSVYGSLNTLNITGEITKEFNGFFNSSSKQFSGYSNFTKSVSSIGDQLQNNATISDVVIDNNQFVIKVCVIGNIPSHNFFVHLEGVSNSTTFDSSFIKNAVLENFKVGSIAYPKSITQLKNLQLTAPQGTSPLVVTSNTKVDNLNADLLDGYHLNSDSVINTVPFRDGNADITSKRFKSTATQGTAPLVVTSTTKVDNLNADLLDGFNTDVNGVANTIPVRDTNGRINSQGIYSTGAIDVVTAGSSRMARLTTDSNGITYIQIYNSATGVWVANPISINGDGWVNLDNGASVKYADTGLPQVRNTHVGRTAPSNSLGLNGDLYVEF